MGSIGALVSLFAGGYVLGAWTACLVLRRRQGDYEGELPVPQVEANLREASR